MHSFYEKHNYNNPDFPIYFHLDHITEKGQFAAHWHEHFELLYFIQGNCMVIGNGIDMNIKENDLLFISPNCIHDIHYHDTKISYYCITVDKSFCDSFGVPLCNGQFAATVKDRKAHQIYSDIVLLMRDQPDYYQSETKSLVMQLIIRCCREANEKDLLKKTKDPGSAIIINTMEYLMLHFREDISVDDVSLSIGYSKYYICHLFKKLTGKSMIDYLNFLRCNNARRLITSKQHNVSESALQSGFTNMSYFTRMYTKQMGHPPSMDIPDK